MRGRGWEATGPGQRDEEPPGGGMPGCRAGAGRAAAGARPDPQPGRAGAPAPAAPALTPLRSIRPDGVEPWLSSHKPALPRAPGLTEGGSHEPIRVRGDIRGRAG